MAGLSLNQRAAVLSIVLLAVGLLIWEAAIPAQKAVGELTEYERLTGGGAPKAGAKPTKLARQASATLIEAAFRGRVWEAATAFA